jgi:hypothetical protein
MKRISIKLTHDGIFNKIYLSSSIRIFTTNTYFPTIESSSEPGNPSVKSRSWNIGLFRSLTEAIETKVTRNSAFNGKYIVCGHGDIITRQKNDGDQVDPHKAEKNVVDEGVREGTENCCKD